MERWFDRLDRRSQPEPGVAAYWKDYDPEKHRKTAREATEHTINNITERARKTRTAIDDGSVDLATLDRDHVAALGITYPEGEEPAACREVLMRIILDAGAQFERTGPTMRSWLRHCYEQARERYANAGKHRASG